MFLLRFLRGCVGYVNVGYFLGLSMQLWVLLRVSFFFRGGCSGVLIFSIGVRSYAF